MRLSQEKNGELSLWDWQTGATRTLASSKHGFEDFVEVTCELGLIQEKNSIQVSDLAKEATRFAIDGPDPVSQALAKGRGISWETGYPRPKPARMKVRDMATGACPFELPVRGGGFMELSESHGFSWGSMIPTPTEFGTEFAHWDLDTGACLAKARVPGFLCGEFKLLSDGRGLAHNGQGVILIFPLQGKFWNRAEVP